MRHPQRYGINLTPLIDVVFIVLAFLLVYSRLDPPQAVEVSLPRVSGENLAEDGRKNVLSLTSEGGLYLDGILTEEGALAAALAALPEDNALELRADREASAEALVRVMRLLSENGISAARLGVAGEAGAGGGDQQ